MGDDARRAARATGTAAGAVLALLALVATGCSTISDQMADASDPGVPVSTSPDAPPVPRSPLETVTWAELDGLVSVLVRNPTERVLRRADAMITLRDGRGTVLASSDPDAGPPGCCTVHSLPPGGTFGVYVDAGEAAAEVAEVEVAYRDLAWGAAVPDGPVTTAEPVRIAEGARGAVAVADVTTEAAVPSATVQAVVHGPDGRLLAVVSGTWRCLPGSTTRRIRMELYRPLPEGSVVESVAVHPDGDEGSCTSAPAPRPH